MFLDKKVWKMVPREYRFACEQSRQILFTFSNFQPIFHEVAGSKTILVVVLMCLVAVVHSVTQSPWRAGNDGTNVPSCSGLISSLRPWPHSSNISLNSNWILLFSKMLFHIALVLFLVWHFPHFGRVICIISLFCFRTKDSRKREFLKMTQLF